MREFLEVLKAEAKSAVWNRGVEVARQAGVTGLHLDAERFEARVKTSRKPTAAIACLYLKDNEWECDCGSPIDPCECIVGAALALDQSLKQGQTLPGQDSKVELVYLFRTVEGGLALERSLRHHSGETFEDKHLAKTLRGMILAQELGNFCPRDEDITIDKLLGERLSGAIPQSTLFPILDLLETSQTELDNVPTVIIRERLKPVIRVIDRKSTIVIRYEIDPSFKRIVAPTLALTTKGLQQIGAIAECGTVLERLPKEQVYNATQFATLSSQIIPELKKNFTVAIESQNLPGLAVQLNCRIHFDVQQLGEKLSVLPTLVYGNPAVARVDGDKLVHLGGAVPRRDQNKEIQLRQNLREKLNLIVGQRQSLEGAAASALISKLASFDGPSASAPAVELLKTPLTPKLIFEDDRPKLSFVSIGEEEVSLEKVMQAYRASYPHITLGSGIWAPVPTKWIKEHEDELEALQLFTEKESALKGNHLAAQILTLADSLGATPPPQFAELAKLLTGNFSFSSELFPLPDGLLLRDYQSTGARWLSGMNAASLGCLLADDMGLGKTVQVLSAIKGKTLVIAPTSVVPNWLIEAARFRPELKLNHYHGSRRKLDDADLTVTSYGVMRLDQSLLSDAGFTTMGLDEAQTIKNPDSGIARAAFSLKAPSRIALTGTPVENRLSDLWSLFHFLNPGYLGSRKHFEQKYERPIASGDSTRLTLLKNKLKPFILRRNKRNVLTDLPLKTESIIYVDLSASEANTYEAVRLEAVEAMAQNGENKTSTFQVLEALLRLRQASCHPRLLPGVERGNSTKLQVLREKLREAVDSGHRCLVFSQWTSLLSLVEEDLIRDRVSFDKITGSTNNRQAVVDRFQGTLKEENPPQVLLISLKAGGTGLNLTAADHVFILDPWWNPATEAQAADRVYRIGQKNPVHVYRLISRGTVEEKVYQLRESKKRLATSALEDAEHNAKLSESELFELLSPLSENYVADDEDLDNSEE